MPKNKLSDLRDHLFETIEALKDTDKPLEVELQRAKMIRDTAQTIINSAKVEVDYLKLRSEISGQETETSEFLEAKKLERPALPLPIKKTGS